MIVDVKRDWGLLGQGLASDGDGPRLSSNLLRLAGMPRGSVRVHFPPGEYVLAPAPAAPFFYSVIFPNSVITSFDVGASLRIGRTPIGLAEPDQTTSVAPSYVGDPLAPQVVVSINGVVEAGRHQIFKGHQVSRRAGLPRVPFAMYLITAPSNPRIYPEWWGAQTGSQWWIQDFYSNGEWIPFNMTSDTEAIQAAILASRPGQVIHFNGEYSVSQVFLAPGRSYMGRGARITRPPRASITTNPQTLAAAIFTANQLAAAFNRHRRSRDLFLATVDKEPIHEWEIEIVEGVSRLREPQVENLRRRQRLTLAVDEATLVTLLNDLMERYNRHLVTAHRNRQAAQRHKVTTADAVVGDPTSIFNLTNSLTQAYEAHRSNFEAHPIRDRRDGVDYVGDQTNILGYAPDRADALFTTFHLVPGRTDLSVITVEGFEFDGNRLQQGRYTAFELERLNGLTIGAVRSGGGRVVARVRDCTFVESAGDGLLVNTYVSAMVESCHFVNCFRAGLAATGGISTLVVRDMLSERVEVDGDRGERTGIDIEIDNTGPDGSKGFFQVELDGVLLRSGNLQVSWSRRPQRRSTVNIRNLVTEDGVLVLGKMENVTARVDNSRFLVSELLAIPGHRTSMNAPTTIIGAEDLIFRNCEFRVARLDYIAPRANNETLAGVMPSDARSPVVPFVPKHRHEYAGALVAWQSISGGSVTFDHCQFTVQDRAELLAKWSRTGPAADKIFWNKLVYEAGGLLGASDAPEVFVAGIVVRRSDAEDINRVIVRNCFVSSDFDFGVYINQGGNVEVRDSVLESSVGIVALTARANVNRNPPPVEFIYRYALDVHGVEFAGTTALVLNATSDPAFLTAARRSHLQMDDVFTPAANSRIAVIAQELGVSDEIADEWLELSPSVSGPGRVIIGSLDERPTLAVPGDRFRLAQPTGRIFEWTFGADNLWTPTLQTPQLRP